jgi:hypothetical protein
MRMVEDDGHTGSAEGISVALTPGLGRRMIRVMKFLVDRGVARPIFGDILMPKQQKETANGVQQEEILTLAEAATFLRVSEEALEDLATKEAVPAQKIGTEWRFLKRGLTDWLRLGQQFYRASNGCTPPGMFGYPPVEELVGLVEERLLSNFAAAEANKPKPGSKEAVMKHFGIWRDDPDLEGMLKDIYKRRRKGP